MNTRELLENAIECMDIAQQDGIETSQDAELLAITNTLMAIVCELNQIKRAILEPGRGFEGIFTDTICPECGDDGVGSQKWGGHHPACSQVNKSR